MNEYSEECLLTFLEKQSQLFDEPVAETQEEAEAFLEDCMAVVVDSLGEVREYFEENGIDVDSMSEEELEDASEVFALPNGQYLIVRGITYIRQIIPDSHIAVRKFFGTFRIGVQRAIIPRTRM